MAAAFLREIGAGRIEVFSGGSEPAESLNPAVVAAMAERDIDITAHSPRRWTDSDLHTADVIVTMGCGDTCPVVPGKSYLDWELDDPSGQPVERVREIRDEIEGRVRDLAAELIS